MFNKEQVASALEMIRCAEINLDNLAKVMPGVDNHPFFKVVKAQIALAISDLDGTSNV